ncbi:hypothetical protein ACH47X_22360 [Promicromonospora kroppenstedtii]|uniref:Uncharacterized protein n=1 Tax=Promicromonospora kroppenstedtii TaxID=440482 RepID=A0ABW7XQ51_9MICO
MKEEHAPLDVFALHAWVDESMQMPGQEREGLYLLAAAVASPATCDPVRENLRELLLKGAERLHWRDESAPRRAKIASAIANHDLVHVVVVGAPIDARKQERARRQCMERLVFELGVLGVSQVWLETRTSSLNERDRRMFAALHAKNAMPARLRIDFALPTDEPMLWVADAVAGAVGQARRGFALDVRDALGHGIDEIDISL